MSSRKVNIDACVGCGFCCKKAACTAALSHGRVDDTGACLELTHDGTRYRCGFILNPPAEGLDWWKSNLAIGEGCCCSLNTERKKYL